MRRSRFLTTLDRARSAEEARAVVDEVRSEFPEATHHCFAFVACEPGSSRSVGFSDDGEPRGTAGRPMLEALMHSGVGEIVAVSSRFYGGVKLGTGGLARAYAGGVVHALEKLPTRIEEPMTKVEIDIDFSSIDPVERHLRSHEFEVTNRDYADAVTLTVELPLRALAQLQEQLAELTAGTARVRSPDGKV